MMPGTHYCCDAPPGTPPHPHPLCPILRRWLTVAQWGEGGIAGVYWLGAPAGFQPPPLHMCVLPVREGAVWCPPEHLRLSPLPVSVYTCLEAWVRLCFAEEERSHG